MAISETKERSENRTSITKIPGYSMWPFTRKGSDKGGGGLCMHYKDSLSAHPWTPTIDNKYEYLSKERQWLLIEVFIE